MFTDLKPLPQGVSIRAARWRQDEAGIAAVRRAVFIEEQAVPEALEWEAVDCQCDWFVASAAGKVVAVARLTPAGRIGRMAVLPAWRRRGLASRLLAEAIAAARRHAMARLELHAQCHAVGLYARFGFRAEPDEFLEAGLPHRRMFLDLKEE